MKPTAIAAGILILCLMAGMLVAGCTSQNPGNAPAQTNPQQPAVTAAQPGEVTGPQGTPAGEVSPAAPDQGLVSDDAGDLAAQADALTSVQETNLTSDSPDFGDILP